MLDKVYLAAIWLAQGSSGGASGQSGGGSGSSGPTGGKITIPAGIPNPSDTDFSHIILGISNWALMISGSLAVLILIIGGVLYLTAAGNQERIEKAKKTIKGAITGIIIILLSAVIVFSIGRVLSGPQATGTGSVSGSGANATGTVGP